MKFFTGLAILFMIFAAIFTAGCTMQNSPAQKPRAQQQQTANEEVLINTELAGRAEETAQTVDAVKDSVAVVMDKEISVAARVTGFDRLRLKSIRKEVHEKIKQIAPGYAIRVTTDKKLFFELQKLDQQIQQGKNSIPLKTRLEKINESMRG